MGEHGAASAERGERRLPGERLEEQAAERVDVGERVHAVLDDLLGRHVLGARDDGSLPREPAGLVARLASPKSLR